MRTPKKYEFIDKDQADQLINDLFELDADGNKIRKANCIAHVVHLGFLPIEQAEYDADGNIVKEAVLNDKYSVDILWESEIPSAWNEYEVQPEVSSHNFA